MSPGTMAKIAPLADLPMHSGMNVTLRPDVYQAHRALLHRHPLLVIDGRLQVEGSVLNVVATRLRAVDDVLDHPPERLPLARQQRMFR